MLVINSIKPKDHDLTNKYSFHETAFRYEFLDTNYLKCSNNFVADSISEIVRVKGQTQSFFEFFT